MNLEPVFKRLAQRPFPDNVRFLAKPIEKFSRHRVAVNSRGTPALLIGFGDDQPKSEMIPPIRLKNLVVQPSVQCRVSVENALEETRFAVIECLSGEPYHQVQFLYFLGPIVRYLGVAPTPKEVSRVIGAIVDLFRSMSRAPSGSIRGLWAELMIIGDSKDPEKLADAWHGDPDERFDFTDGNCVLEIKSTSTRRRTHQFSYEQLQPDEDDTAIIASLFVEDALRGTSIRELLIGIERAVASVELVLKVYQQTFQILGAGWEDAIEKSFNIDLARASLRYYDARFVPHLEPPIPHGVTAIQFRSDLSLANPVAISDFAIAANLFSVLSPSTSC